ITSAPKSASKVPRNGPASIEPSSSTRTPLSGPSPDMAGASANDEPVLLRIVGIDHELVEAGEVRRARDLGHEPVEVADLDGAQHATAEQRAGDALRRDRLLGMHLAVSDQHAHHVRRSGAARRAIEGPIGEYMDVLVLRARRAARSPDGDEVDRADVRHG